MSNETLFAAIVLCIVFFAVGLGLVTHQNKDFRRDAIGYFLIVLGVLGALVSISLKVVL